MSDPVLIALIGACFSFLTTVFTALVAYMTLRLKQTIVTLEENTNSIKDALVATTHKLGISEGVEKERGEQREREEGR